MASIFVSTANLDASSGSVPDDLSPPEYPTKPLEYFEPMVRKVFARKAYDPAVIQDGVSIGL